MDSLLNFVRECCLRNGILKKLSVLLFLVLFCASVGKVWYCCLDGFSTRRIHFDFSEAGAVSFLEPDLQPIFSKKYSYLGRGRQCYAFVSDDDRYVLKLPRSDCYRIPFWLRSCSFAFLNPRKEVSLASHKKRCQFLLNSFSLAHSELKKETGLLYVHLSPTDYLKTYVSIYDRLGRLHRLDLDKTAFVFQEKKPLMIPLFKQRLNEGDREGAKVILEAFMDLIATRAKKGIFGKDGSFLRNFGYDGDRVIQVDIGDFYRPAVEDFSFALSFERATVHLVEWLGEIDSDMQSWFKMRMSEIIKEAS